MLYFLFSNRRPHSLSKFARSSSFHVGGSVFLEHTFRGAGRGGEATGLGISRPSPSRRPSPGSVRRDGALSPDGGRGASQTRGGGAGERGPDRFGHRRRRRRRRGTRRRRRRSRGRRVVPRVHGAAGWRDGAQAARGRSTAGPRRLVSEGPGRSQGPDEGRGGGHAEPEPLQAGGG